MATKFNYICKDDFGNEVYENSKTKVLLKLIDKKLISCGKLNRWGTGISC